MYIDMYTCICTHMFMRLVQAKAVDLPYFEDLWDAVTRVSKVNTVTTTYNPNKGGFRK